MKTKSPKLFRWALWWGLGIMVASLAVIVVADVVSPSSPADGDFGEPFMDAMYRIVYKYGIWPMVVLFGVVAPVVEELVFRLWGNGKAWTGFISVVLMALLSISIAWWVAPLTLAVGIAIMVVLRSDRTKRLFALMLFSSLIFTLMHTGNYDPEQGLLLYIFALLDKFGMGLLASYLVINHNILWSMGLHILNNSVLTLILGVGFNMIANVSIVIVDDDYRITTEPVLTKSEMPDSYKCGWLNDSVFFDISTTDFVADFFLCSKARPNTDSLKVVCEMKNYPKMSVKIEMLGGSQNYDGVVHAMENNGLIAIDTVGDTMHIRSTYDPLSSLGSL